MFEPTPEKDPMAPVTPPAEQAPVSPMEPQGEAMPQMPEKKPEVTFGHGKQEAAPEVMPADAASIEEVREELNQAAAPQKRVDFSEPATPQTPQQPVEEKPWWKFW